MSEQNYWLNSFNTKLTPEQEVAFTNWIEQLSRVSNRNRLTDMNDYDMKGYFANGGAQDLTGGHFPDTYKKPNHPTFSVESQYNGAPNPLGGEYKGGQWGDGTYTPSQWNLQNRPPEEMKRYFSVAEPQTRLILEGQQ